MRGSGFQKRTPPHEWGSPRVAMVKYAATGGASCSCGWYSPHKRRKVLDDAIDRHLERRHQGKGVRL